MSIAKLMTAMVTPFNEDNTVNYNETADLAEYLLGQGNDGLVVSGTTGESPTLAVEEKIQLFSTVVGKIGKRAQIWAGTGSYSTQASIDLSKQAETTGVHGIMLVTPYYNKPTQEGLYQHFKKIAEASSLPVMLYNVPSRTGANLLPETVGRLAAIENIVAIKEASGSMNQMSALKSCVPEDMIIYSGDDSLTLPMLSLGASGVISVAAHLMGREIKEMIQSFESGDYQKARSIHYYLYPIYKGLFVNSNPIPVKEALNMIGMNVGYFRMPLSRMNDEDREKLKGLLVDYQLI